MTTTQGTGNPGTRSLSSARMVVDLVYEKPRISAQILRWCASVSPDND